MDFKHIESYQSSCRICLTEKIDMEDILSIADMLMSCAPIVIEPNDGLPNSICSDCVCKLNHVNEFRVLCVESDNFLREKIITKIDIAEWDQTNDNDCLQMEEIHLNTENEKLDSCTKKVKNGKNKIKSPRKSNKGSAKAKAASKVSEEDAESILSQEDDLEKEGSLQCRFCDMKFRYTVRLKKHEMKHLRGLKCDLCGKDFPTLKQLANHINIHNRKGAHLCQTCGKQFTLPENLRRHQRIHAGIRPYQCHLCNRSFTQSNELKSHLVSHTSEKNHLCSVCGNKYSRLISLRVHMRRIHSVAPNHRPYICSVCARNFKDRRDLAQHMQIHTGERSHVCKDCGKAFNRSSNLRVHERIHTGHKPHVCIICRRAFIQKHVLLTHMRTHPISDAVEVKMMMEDLAKEEENKEQHQLDVSM